MTKHEIFAYKTLLPRILLLFWVVVMVMEVQRVWITITWRSMVQMLKILIEAYTNRIVRGQSTLKDVIERYFWDGLGRERLKALNALYALYANVLVEKSPLVVKSKI